MPTDGISKGRQVYHCGDCGRRTIPDAAYQRPGTADKERALAIYQEGSSLSAIARIFGVSLQAVSQWVKEGARRTVPDAPAGRQAHCRFGRQPRPAVVIAFDEMWTYRQARRRGKRQDVWVWTEVVSEADGSRWADAEVHEKRGDAVGFAGFAAGGLAFEILRQFMLRIPML